MAKGGGSSFFYVAEGFPQLRVDGQLNAKCRSTKGTNRSAPLEMLGVLASWYWLSLGSESLGVAI